MHTSCQARLVTLETLYDTANGPNRALKDQMGGDAVIEQESHIALSHTKTHIALGKHRRLLSRASFEVEDRFRVLYISLHIEHISLVCLPQAVRTSVHDLRLSICSNAFTTRSTCTSHHQVRGNFATNSYGRVTSSIWQVSFHTSQSGIHDQHALGSFSYFHLRDHDNCSRAHRYLPFPARGDRTTALGFSPHNIIYSLTPNTFSSPHPALAYHDHVPSPRPFNQLRLTTRSLAYDKSLITTKMSRWAPSAARGGDALGRVEAPVTLRSLWWYIVWVRFGIYQR
jgi:hypothetical protein